MAITETSSKPSNNQANTNTTAPKKPSRRLLARRVTAPNKNITKRNATESPLLRLPPEIRNRIWTYVLGGRTLHIGVKRRRPWFQRICPRNEDDGDYPRCSGNIERQTRYHTRHSDCMKPVRARKWRVSFLALLKTSRQLHLEAALLPYLQNTFAFVDMFAFDLFVNGLLLSQRRSVRSVILSCDNQRAYVQLDNIWRLSNLTEFTFHQRVGQWLVNEPQRFVLLGYRGCLYRLPLLKVAIRTTIGPDESASDALMEKLAARTRDLEETLIANDGGN